MRTPTLPALFAAAALAAAPAQAGSLVHVVLTLHFDAGGGVFAPAQFQVGGMLGGSAHGSGPTATWTAAAGALPTGTLTHLIPTSVFPPISQVQYIVSGNPGAGAFAASSPGSMLVLGTIRMKAYGGLTLPPQGFPIGFGAPTMIVPPLASAMGVTTRGNAWTTKTAVTGTQSMVGANSLVNGAGSVVLVSALDIVTSVITDPLPSFAVLTLTYASAPEPGALLLVATAVGLAGVGRRVRAA